MFSSVSSIIDEICLSYILLFVFEIYQNECCCNPQLRVFFFAFDPIKKHSASKDIIRAIVCLFMQRPVFCQATVIFCKYIIKEWLYVHLLYLYWDLRRLFTADIFLYPELVCGACTSISNNAVVCGKAVAFQKFYESCQR